MGEIPGPRQEAQASAAAQLAVDLKVVQGIQAEQPIRQTLAQVIDYARTNQEGRIITSADEVQLPQPLEAHIGEGGTIGVDLAGNVYRQSPPKKRVHQVE